VPRCRGKGPNGHFSAREEENHENKDSLTEKSGFELPVPGEMIEIAALERLHAI
jgi:hypothetical protein